MPFTSKNPRIGRWAGLVLLALIAGLGSMTAYVSFLTYKEYANIDQPSRYSVSGFATRADHEFTRLEYMISQAAVPGSGVGPDDVGLWFDIVANRADVLGNGKLSGVSAGIPEATAIIAAMRRGLADLKPMIDHVGDPAVSLKALEILKPVGDGVTRLAIQTYAEAESLDRADAQSLISLHAKFTYVGAGFLALTLLMLADVSHKNKLLGHAGVEQRRLAASLEASNLDLARQARRFDDALNNMGQGLCMISPDGAVAVHNDRFEKLMAPGLDLAPGMTLRDVAEATGSARLARILEDGIPASGGKDAEPAVVVVGGVAIETTASPMTDGGTVLTFQDVTERHKAEERIAYMAHHDDLTKIYNRLYFNQRLEEVLAKRNAKGEATLVLAIDLDGFKDVNDTYGHAVGDAVLREIAWRMADEVGPDDMLARLGGDEFAIMRPVGADGDDGTELAYRLVAAVSEPIPTTAGEVRLGTSIGIARAPTDGVAGGDLMKSADIALYAAKDSGRGTVCLYDACADDERRATRALALDLQGAVERGEFVLHFQPIVDANSESPKLYEALVRWRHPQRGLVPPNVFIPMAEESGDIVAIGAWVLKEACRAAQTWAPDIGVAVNLSAVQFAHGGVPEMVAAGLAASGLAPARLEIELTESVLLLDSVEMIRTLTTLKELGVRIAMDDFGTGYASMSYLHRFPFDKIKIDQSFVRGLKPGASGYQIVLSMTELAGRLSLVACAEGVETRDQADALIKMGCNQLQGYFFGRPEPRADGVTARDGPKAVAA